MKKPTKEELEQAVRRLRKDATICRQIKSTSENYDSDGLDKVADYLQYLSEKVDG